jgi:hypothetical protein
LIAQRRSSRDDRNSTAVAIAYPDYQAFGKISARWGGSSRDGRFRQIDVSHMSRRVMCAIACNFKTEDKAMEKKKIEIPKQYESLFGQLPLLEDEDREAYLALRSAVIHDLQPENLMG